MGGSLLGGMKFVGGGGGVYWGRIFLGGGMSKFSAGGGDIPYPPPVGKTLYRVLVFKTLKGFTWSNRGSQTVIFILIYLATVNWVWVYLATVNWVWV